jgi:hypothetical protein
MCEEAFCESASKFQFIDEDTVFPCFYDDGSGFDDPFVQEGSSGQHKDLLCRRMYGEELLHERTVARVGRNGDGKEEAAVDKEVIEHFRKLRRLHHHDVGKIVEIMIEAE